MVALGCAVPLVALLASGRTVVWRDTAKLFEPNRALVVDALHHLRLPLWNPHEALGFPLFAQQLHAVLHPVSVAFGLLAPGSSMDALLVAQILVAAVGAFALARTVGASNAGAAVAGFGYGLSGYVLGMTSIVQYLGAAALAPWAIAALRAAATRPRFAPLAAIAVACLAFAGEPQWAIAAVVMGMILAAEAGGRRGFVLAALAAALGTLVGAIQLVPAWAYFAESARAAGVRADERSLWSFAPWRVLELVAPGFFGGRPGGPEAPVYYDLAGGGRYGIPFATSVYLGVVLVVLAASAARAPRIGRVIGATALAWLWVALGKTLGAEPLLHHVPVWGAFRYTEKLIGPFTLCVAVLAAIGADRTSSRPDRVPAAAAVAGAVCGGLALLLSGSSGMGALFRGAAPEVAALARERLAIGSFHAAAGLFLLAGIALVATRRRSPATFTVGAATLVFAQALAAAPFALHVGRAGARDASLLPGLRGSDTPVRVGVPVTSIDSSDPRAPGEFERLSALEAEIGVSSYNVALRVDGIEPYTGLYPRSLARVRDALYAAFGPEQIWVAWRRFAMTHVSVAPVTEARSRAVLSAAIAGGAPVASDPRSGAAVYGVPHRPYAFFAEDVAPAETVDDAVRKLVDVLEAGRSTVVIEAARPASLAPGRVTSVRRETERVVVEAESAGDGLLVVNDAYWPGWLATIDGAPAPIVRVDGLVRGVVWPSGRHVLEMRYVPREVTFGVALTLLGLVAVAALAIVGARRGEGRTQGSRLA